jgi:hypothetical protein
MGAAVLVALAVGGIVSMADDSPTSEAAAPVSVAGNQAGAGAGAPAPAASAGPGAPAVRAPVGPAPIIAEGRRELGDSMFAVRAGDSVTVYFDTETLRTRFDWKFEGVVRATLPLVFGDDARLALDSVPAGTLVRGGRLLEDLPTRGILLRMPGRGGIKVWPVTREGRDGPLVVAYRAASAR